MVLKKPYAFLIKYFRLIHIILSLNIIIIISLFGNISDFFSQYVKGTRVGTIGLASTYINFNIYLLLILIIAFSLAMFLLMKKKEKPTILYITLFIYYLIVLFMTIFATSILKSIEVASLTQQSSRAYRDIFLIISLPQYYFLVMSIIRGIGFDVKKFNFTKDLQELEIKSEDNEEFEFVLGNDTFKYKRKLRRILRELKYYILENKFIFTIIISAIIIVVAGIFIANSNIFNKTYKAGSSGVVGNFHYKLVSAYETKYDYNGNVISKDNKYLVLDIIITNKSSVPQTLNNTMFYLKTNNLSFYNMPSLRNYFIDIGTSYVGDNIPAFSTNNYLFLFEISEEINTKNYYLNILKDVKNKNGETKYNYSEFRINPQRFNDSVEKKPIKINQTVYFGTTFFSNSNLNINSAEIKSSYEYIYEICNEKCTEYYDVIAPSNPAEDSILILDYSLELAEDIGLNENIKSDKAFFDKFLKIEYNYNNKNIIRSVNVKVLSNIKNKTFIEIPKIAERSKSLNISLNTREGKYYINLKGDNN
ncbi:MAG: hypothetical protein PHG03_05350 [Bacilli bacterium]|nr:hypothetical protein [Bacilli bacterium]MDD4795961.1 hypothetical protein [Bacilli bacterium]